MDGRGLSCDRVVIVVVAGVVVRIIMADRVIFARRIIIDVRYGDSRGSIGDGSTLESGSVHMRVMRLEPC